jgi:hypothetical protein
MAKNNFSLKSLAELENMASSYGTRIASFLEDRSIDQYTIADVSKEEFANITTFINNITIKNGSEIEQRESSDSIFLSGMLRKYFEESITLDDLIKLKDFINTYNSDQKILIYENIYKYIFGIQPENIGIDKNSIFARITDNILTKIENLISKTSVSDTKDIKGWFTGIDGDEEKIDIDTFYKNYFKRSNIINALVILQLINYLKSPSNMFFNEGMDMDFLFTDEDDQNIKINIKQATSTRRNQSGNIETFRRYSTFLNITADSGEVIISLPIDIRESIGTPDNLFDVNTGSIEVFFNTINSIITTYNIIDITGLTSVKTLEQLETILENNLYEFLTSAYSPETGDEAIYFGSTIEELKSKNIRDFENSLYLFYYKDLFQDNFQLSNSISPEKNYANEYETTIAKDGHQLIFIDIKNLPVSSQQLNLIYQGSITYRDKLKSLFNISDVTTSKITYTLLYKELNPKLREHSLSDTQEYIFARMLQTSFPNRNIIFENNRGGISFSSSIDVFYRNYRENDNLFKISADFYRYKYFYSNVYISRMSNESDIIGYYVGDSSVLSKFTNNYGAKDYQKKEIELFLKIYQETRNYYYRVLLNKSFIQEEQYKLYERLFISFFAIERFLNSKIENIHDPDYFNSRDIFNFLESYGLGVLNDEKYNFIIGGKDYKLNIVKLFNELVKLKGSRNVINVLLRVFEIGDMEAEIKKFLIFEQTDYDDVNGMKQGEGKVKFIEVPYFSDNGSREIFSALVSGTVYDEFLSDDIYWDPNEVPEKVLLDIGLDVSETKYLSLTLSENIYKKYILSRYMMSTIDYIQEKLVDNTGSTVLYDTKLETQDLFGVINPVSIASHFEAIKVMYKALLRLYSEDSDLIDGEGNWNVGVELPTTEPENPEIGDQWFDTLTSTLYTYEGNWNVGVELPTTEPENPEIGDQWFDTLTSTLYTATHLKKYYGINNNIEWSNLKTAISSVISNFNDIEDEFLEAHKEDRSGDPTVPTTFNRYNIYKESEG